MRLRALATIAASAFAFAAPAFAHEGHHADGPSYPAANGGYPGAWQPGAPDRDAWNRQREDWLRECRYRTNDRRSGATGAVLGGVVGGVIGHEVAGRHDRTLGTVAGAAVGAVAGAAIERGTEGRRYRDECEAMLDNYHAGYNQQGYYGAAYAMPVMMVPMAMVSVPGHSHSHGNRDCKDVVTTEYVTTYDTVYRKVREVRYRSVPTYKRVQISVPDKRVRIVPDKRLRMTPDKRVISQ